MANNRKVSLPLWVSPPIVTIDARVESSLQRSNTAVAVGVSGGKDSCAVAFAVDEYLQKIEFQGPRLLIHSDLGLVEWKDSLPVCRRLARTLGWELVVVRRAAGDMMDRWNKRWSNNVERYANLECVKLIPPWSTASMRFCTAELKRDVICRELVLRFPHHEIISVNGIRRDESPNRAKAPITKYQSKLTSKKYNTTGYDWHAILEWNLEGTIHYVTQQKKFKLHEAYTKYLSTRVSCAFCILGSQWDLGRSTLCESNRPAYEAMVDLEMRSSFSFQDKHWLADVAPRWNNRWVTARLPVVKDLAVQRREIEASIPEHLLYTEGWPTVIPTKVECRLLSGVRQTIARLLNLEIQYTTPQSIRERYEHLYHQKQ